MSVIGSTTSTESRAFDEDPAFARRFTRLIVDELSVEQTLAVMTTVRPGLMAHYRHRIGVSDDVLASVVQIAEANSRAGQHRPDNAITLLDRAMADRVLEQKKLIVQAENAGDTVLAQALRSFPQVPLTSTRVLDVAKRLMTGNAQRKDLDVAALSATLTSRLQGQDDVLAKLTDRLAREELDLFPTKTPTTWLFAGASGVGKTEAVKIIAEETTGTEPIILNMTEFHSEWSTSKIIGSPPGYVGSDSNQELPFDTLESNPHRVILLDEFEKADKAVQRLFLSAFDEGYIRNAHGKMLDFSKALVICTTNAARDSLDGKMIGFGNNPKTISNQSLNKALEQFFDAELLGRFSLVVGSTPSTGRPTGRSWPPTTSGSVNGSSRPNRGWPRRCPRRCPTTSCAPSKRPPTWTPRVRGRRARLFAPGSRTTCSLPRPAPQPRHPRRMTEQPSTSHRALLFRNIRNRSARRTSPPMSGAPMNSANWASCLA
ncbi:AAA family ATPase [Streptomyces sp. FXJ1.4098]|nr:AAA family ATPase [Streptomyces sp. FXJ1.4098]